MKKILIFFLLLFFTNLFSQDLKDFVVPKGYKKIVEIKGDLDKDGIDEYVFVFNTTKEIKSDFENGYKREFFILKKINKKFKIWQHNNSILFADKTGFSPEYNSLPEFKIKNGILEITQIFDTNSRHTQTYKDKFRFQNNDFYLIGSEHHFDDTCSFNFSEEINFSTGKIIVNQTFQKCFDDENEPVEKDFNQVFFHNFKPIKMNNFKVGDNLIKIPKTKQYFHF